MQLSIIQENLKYGLFITGHITDKNPQLPILNNIMIKAEKGKIELISTNLEIGIICNIRGKVEKEGSFTVNAKIFKDYVNLLPNKIINIETITNDLNIKCANYQTKIKGESAENFPLIPIIERKNYYSIAIDEFKSGLNQVIFAVNAANETKPELSGVFFSFNNKKLTMAATDSYRLAEKIINIQNFTYNEDKDKNIQNVIIPLKTLQELLRIISGLKENEEGDANAKIKIYISDNQILFTIKSMELVSRLIDGKYIDYKQIIPKISKTTVIIHRIQFIQAIKAASLFSKTEINDVHLDFLKNQTVISSASGQTGESVINLDSNINGENNGFAINCNHLLDGLNNIKDENIKINIVNNTTPCMLQSEQENQYLYLIMPLKQ